MQRPPAELRRLEDEERRRVRAHRRLRRERRLRLGLWIPVAAFLLVAIGLAVFSLG
ncbi:MAG: hypothetical protein HY713_03210 [candidate division NC10 bacterium]|nr:hypothetical protein [candidate division NC10 bacterium]